VSQELNAAFVNYAADILADTERGLSGPEIVKATVAQAVENDVVLPHPAYPFVAHNKRTALAENIMAFPEAIRYRVLLELCDHPSVLERNKEAAQKLKLRLMARYGHLAQEALSTEVNATLVQQARHWLEAFPDSLVLYNEALAKYTHRIFLRNLLDDLRLSLEKLLQGLLSNQRTLENQLSEVGAFLKARGASPEHTNMFVKLIDYYCKYQNNYVKHDDAVIEEEIEFLIEITSSFMKHLVRLAGRDLV
jgi:hypothetical protein